MWDGRAVAKLYPEPEGVSHMNPLLSEALGAILRWALTGLAGWFVSRGIWSADAASQYVAATAIGLLTLGWSLWAKYKTRLKFVTALASPEWTTEVDVEHRIATAKAWGQPLPSVTTPKDEAPRA
jgi:hypothetical protein